MENMFQEIARISVENETTDNQLTCCLYSLLGHEYLEQ
jgi:hypothetical protein